MSSVLSSYRQKAQTGKYLIVTGTITGYTISSTKIPTTVAISDSASSEAMVDSDGTAGSTIGVAAAMPDGTLLLDLGREVVVYSNQASITGVTSPFYKQSIYRQVSLATAGTGSEGAPGQSATTYWVKVWSASGTGVAVARV
jgi:hypothetical protein